MEKIRNVFIDCGAWVGDTILEFRKHYKDYEIFAFECHPNLAVALELISEKYNVTFINKAVWIDDEKLNLYLGIDGLTQSSSIFSNKKKYISTKNPSEVDAIDFSSWVKNMFNENDNIICKMNIEGAEYDVLEKMISDGSILYIKKLYVAWHYNKLKGFPKSRHDILHAKLKKMTELHSWHYDEKEGKNPF